VGRFERDDNEARHLPETLGIATEGLRSTIEVEVARIVESAEARAAEIEDRALEKAGRLDQESDRRMGAVFEDSRARVQLMFAEIQSVENALDEAVRSLRAGAERLTSELSRAHTEPLEVIQPAAAPDQEEPAEAAPEPPAAAEPDVDAPAAEPDGDAPRPQPADPAVRELIRQQLVSFAEGGRARADGERMLLRFKQGDQYFDLLDEIYPDETPGRRGLLRRRKGRD
jgi:cell division septum initiation protein DivIVA